MSAGHGRPPIRWVFLDRDGTLNIAPAPGSYITMPEMLKLLPHAATAIRRLNEAGVWTGLVTNQRGIARGEMTEHDLRAVHARLREELAGAGARLDAIYHCPHELGGCSCRKPQPGMLLRAQREHPGLSFSEAAMVGDNGSDVQAGRRAGAATVLLGHAGTRAAIDADFVAKTLLDAVERLSRDRGLAESPRMRPAHRPAAEL